MKELTLEILEKALEDWKKPAELGSSTLTGLCNYFKIVHGIDYFFCEHPPWEKYATKKINWISYHFQGYGCHHSGIGRRQRVEAIKGMIKDLKAKQNEDTNKS